MKFLTSNEALKEHKKLKSRWSRETSLSQRILMSILDKLEHPQNINKLLSKIEKLERDLDYYIKEYPEQLKELKKAETPIKKQ